MNSCLDVINTFVTSAGSAVHSQSAPTAPATSSKTRKKRSWELSRTRPSLPRLPSRWTWRCSRTMTTDVWSLRKEFHQRSGLTTSCQSSEQLKQRRSWRRWRRCLSISTCSTWRTRQSSRECWTRRKDQVCGGKHMVLISQQLSRVGGWRGTWPGVAWRVWRRSTETSPSNARKREDSSSAAWLAWDGTLLKQSEWSSRGWGSSRKVHQKRIECASVDLKNVIRAMWPTPVLSR